MGIDVLTLSAAKSYTDESLLGGGSVVGKNVTISSITPINGGNRVTFSYTLDDGTVKTSTMDIMDGVDGKNPSITIDANNNWFVNGVDTGVKAKGEKGDTGSGFNTTRQYSSVSDMMSDTNPANDSEIVVVVLDDVGNFYMRLSSYVDPDGITNGYLPIGSAQDISVIKGDPGKDGTDGLTPHIDSATKHWFLGTTDTGVIAEGVDGTDGEDGVTPHIDSITKHWMIGSQDTGIIAEGQDGKDGVDGITPHIDTTTKHWFIGDTDTGIVAEGGNGSSEKITVDSDMSDTSENPVQNKVIKKYVDDKSVDISAEAGNAIVQKSDGIFVEDKTDEITQIKDDISPIKQYTRYVNTDLDWGYLRYTGTALNVNIGQVLTFSNNQGTIACDASNGIFRLEGGKRYLVGVSLRNKQGSCMYRIHKAGDTSNVLCYGFKYANNFDTSAYSNKELNCIISPSEDTDYCISIGEMYESCQVLTYEVYIAEISKSITIDPVEHTNTESGIEDTPVGHIIPYMGNNAPAHYLICDGTEYNIVDYPYLAQHFNDEFGSYNYFGGDGTTTFAVPDLRGEFLRGTGVNYHANQGSGSNVGKHQDATEHIYFGVNTSTKEFWTDTITPRRDNPNTQIGIANMDSALKLTVQGDTRGFRQPLSTWTVSTNQSHYTSRPTNTSVLYCIKYEPTYFMQYTNQYAGFHDTVLFDGDASAVGSYTLADDITNYDYILVEISSGHSNTSFVPASNTNAGKATRLIKVSDIHMASRPNLGSDQFIETQWYEAAKSWYYFLSYWFISSTQFYIDEIYYNNLLNPRIKKITGIKGGA